MRSVLSVHWKDWCWSWNSSTLATWYEELTHLKRPWFWERLKAGEEGDDRGWDGLMVSPVDGHEFDQALGVDEGQGSPVCCSPWVCRELDMTEQLNWTDGNDSQYKWVRNLWESRTLWRSGAPNSLWVVTAAKLKDACSLEENNNNPK